MADRATIAPVYSLAMAQALVNAFGTRPAAALAAALEVHLWQDPVFAPVPTTPLASFTTAEANYTGYVAATGVTLTSPVNLNGDAQGAIANVLFDTTAPVTVPNTVYGYWLQSGSTLLMFEKFPTGSQVNFAVEGDYLNLTLAMPAEYDQNGAAA
jgi:hypothetical protein